VTPAFSVLSAQNVHPEPSVRDLGVITDSRLTMADHVTAVCKAGYYKLRQLRRVVQSLTSEASIKVTGQRVHQQPHRLLQLSAIRHNRHPAPSMQSVQNAAVRLVTGTRRSEHITPVLMSLHWLPVRRRITFKVATIVHKCLNGRSCSMYLSNDLQYAG